VFSILVKTRQANINDVEEICSLISEYAGLDRMLFRSKADICEHLQTFTVAEDYGQVVGCGALSVIWTDLAEIKSLAVAQDFKGKGVGNQIVRTSIDNAKKLGIKRIFALTLEAAFFQKLGFKVLEKDQLPMKVWSDCARCPKQDHCDEVAVALDIA
jgi:amino-acid N-acetyltransferase